VTKEQIDIFFTRNDTEIESIIAANMAKSPNPNRESIKTDLYLLCIEKMDIITDLSLNWIKHLAATEYRWKNSKSNRINVIFANEIELSNVDKEDEPYTDDLQEFEYCLHNYLINAKPSERIFYDIYVNKGIRTVRAVSKHLHISHHAAYVLIKEFKSKIRNHERKE
jgi:hypothetical protein